MAPRAAPHDQKSWTLYIPMDAAHPPLQAWPCLFMSPRGGLDTARRSGPAPLGCPGGLAPAAHRPATLQPVTHYRDALAPGRAGLTIRLLSLGGRLRYWAHRRASALS